MKNTFSWREFFIRRLNALAVLSLAAAIAGQLGAAHWFAELFAHFMPYYAAVFLLAALFRGGRRRWLWAACVFVCAFWLMQPFEIHRPSETRHSLVWYNVNLDNPQPQAETAALLDVDADILALAEIDLADTGWVQLRRHYPYGCERESDSPFALAVWSRQPYRPAKCAFPAVIPISAPFPAIPPFTPSIRRHPLVAHWRSTVPTICATPPAPLRRKTKPWWPAT